MNVKALIAALLLALASAAAYAACTTHTIFTSDGRMVMCTTCCSGGNCQTTCI